jgi:hypothetical protein
MEQYIDRDTAIRTAIEMCVKVVGHGITQIDAVDIANAFEDIPTADVVPKSEVERLVDKWIGAEGLTNDEKTLRLIEALKDEAHRYERYYFNHEYDKMIAEAKAEVAREIFAEIEKAISSMKYNANTPRKTVKVEELKEQVDWVLHEVVPQRIAELKKKYIPQDCRTCKHMLSCEPNVFGICDEYEEETKNDQT